jgi:uncharacterized protein (DUF427 family)
LRAGLPAALGRVGSSGTRRNERPGPVVAISMATGHRITIRPAGQHVEVTLGGQQLAASDRALLLQETGLPGRYYIPPQDVRTELLAPTATQTTCPFKGQARYWSLRVGGEVHEDIVWSYPEPIAAAAQIAGLMCFRDDAGPARVRST